MKIQWQTVHKYIKYEDRWEIKGKTRFSTILPYRKDQYKSIQNYSDWSLLYYDETFLFLMGVLCSRITISAFWQNWCSIPFPTMHIGLQTWSHWTTAPTHHVHCHLHSHSVSDYTHLDSFTTTPYISTLIIITHCEIFVQLCVHNCHTKSLFCYCSWILDCSSGSRFCLALWHSVWSSLEFVPVPRHQNVINIIKTPVQEISFRRMLFMSPEQFHRCLVVASTLLTLLFLPLICPHVYVKLEMYIKYADILYYCEQNNQEKIKVFDYNTFSTSAKLLCSTMP